MKQTIGIACFLVAAAAFMGFDQEDPWSDLEGEWAYRSTTNCGGINSIDLTYDYRRDQDGNLVYLNQRPPTRRDRLATARQLGQMRYLANVGDNVNISSAGQTIHLKIRRTSFLPFRGFDDLFLMVENDDMLIEQSADGDADALLRAIGQSPVILVRCPEAEE